VTIVYADFVLSNSVEIWGGYSTRSSS